MGYCLLGLSRLCFFFLPLLEESLDPCGRFFWTRGPLGHSTNTLPQLRERSWLHPIGRKMCFWRHSRARDPHYRWICLRFNSTVVCFCSFSGWTLCCMQTSSRTRSSPAFEKTSRTLPECKSTTVYIGNAWEWWKWRSLWTRSICLWTTASINWGNLGVEARSIVLHICRINHQQFLSEVYSCT